MEKYYKGDQSLDRLLDEEIPCPYCLGFHRIREAESNGEDEYYAYLSACPDLGEVRVTFQFQDKFKRKESENLTHDNAQREQEQGL